MILLVKGIQLSHDVDQQKKNSDVCLKKITECIFYYLFAVRLLRSIFQNSKYDFQSQLLVFSGDFWMANLSEFIILKCVHQSRKGRQTAGGTRDSRLQPASSLNFLY